jgi:hypothetical protein
MPKIHTGSLLEKSPVPETNSQWKSRACVLLASPNIEKQTACPPQPPAKEEASTLFFQGLEK